MSHDPIPTWSAPRNCPTSDLLNWKIPLYSYNSFLSFCYHLTPNHLCSPASRTPLVLDAPSFPRPSNLKEIGRTLAISRSSLMAEIPTGRERGQQSLQGCVRSSRGLVPAPLCLPSLLPLLGCYSLPPRKPQGAIALLAGFPSNASSLLSFPTASSLLKLDIGFPRHHFFCSLYSHFTFSLNYLACACAPPSHTC